MRVVVEMCSACVVGICSAYSEGMQSFSQTCVFIAPVPVATRVTCVGTNRGLMTVESCPNSVMSD